MSIKNDAPTQQMPGDSQFLTSPAHSHSSGRQRSTLGKLVKQERLLLSEVFAIVIEYLFKKHFFAD